MLKENKSILSDCFNLSSGTISGIINNNDYLAVDSFQNNLIEFVLNSNSVFLSWVDAVNTFIIKKNNFEVSF